MSLIGLEGWWMAPSQMGMWQGSLEVFCGAVLNKKSSLPTKKKKKKKRGLDLRSPNTVASPSSIMAFNTFLYTPELHINIHPYTTTAPASSSDFNSHFTPHGHLLPHWVHLILPLNHLFDNFFTRVHASHASEHDKSAPVWVFWWSCQPLYRSLFRCGNLIFGVPLRRGNGHKGGEVKVQSPRLGGLWWSAWELEKGKLWLEYEWNHRRGGEERGKKRGEEKGRLWLNYSPHHG